MPTPAPTTSVSAPTTATPTSTPSSVTPLPTSTATARGEASFEITEPASAASPSARTRSFLSPSTQSIAISINGAVTDVPLAINGSMCMPSNGNTVCTVNVAAQNGPATITATTYDQADGGGTTLAVASTTATIDGTTTIPLALSAIAKSASIALSPMNPQFGTATNLAVTVAAYDADNNLIVGPQPFASPIALTDSDTTGHTVLSAATFVAPTSNVSLAYDGASVNATISTSNVSNITTTTLANELIPAIVPTFYSSGGSQGDLTLGADNALYYSSTSGLGRVTQTGQTSVISGPPVNEIASPPNGNGIVWTMNAASGGENLSRLNSDNSYTNFSIDEPGKFILGPDANFWAAGGNGATKYTQTGQRTFYQAPRAANGENNETTDVAVGSDGNLWFADILGVLRLTTGGTFTQFSTTQIAAVLGAAIVSGSDGALYVDSASGISRVTTAGSVTNFLTKIGVQTTDGFTQTVPTLTSASDGNIWYATLVYGSMQIDGFSRLTPGGQNTDFVLLPFPTNPDAANTNTHISSMLATSDGSVWFTRNGSLGKFIVPSR